MVDVEIKRRVRRGAEGRRVFVQPVSLILSSPTRRKSAGKTRSYGKRAIIWLRPKAAPRTVTQVHHALRLELRDVPLGPGRAVTGHGNFQGGTRTREPRLGCNWETASSVFYGQAKVESVEDNDRLIALKAVKVLPRILEDRA